MSFGPAPGNTALSTSRWGWRVRGLLVATPPPAPSWLPWRLRWSPELATLEVTLEATLEPELATLEATLEPRAGYPGGYPRALAQLP